MRASYVTSSSRSSPRESATARWTASSERSPGGPRMPAWSSTSRLRSMKTRSRSARRVSTRHAGELREAARSASVRGSVAATGSDRRRRWATRAEVSGSGVTSLTNAEVSRYTSLPLIAPQLLEDLRERPLARLERSWHPVQEVGEAALGRRDAALGDQLVVPAAVPQRHQARHRVAVLGHLHGFPTLDAAHDAAE